MNNQMQTEMQKPTPGPATRERMFDAKELLGTAREVQIRLDEQIYTLRRTRFGKLLLTK